MKQTKATAKRNLAGLIWPIGLLGLAIAGWSLFWFIAAHQLLQRVNAYEAVLKAQGFVIRHDPLEVKGYPYRMSLNFVNFSLENRDGQGLAAPKLLAEANAYQINKWVIIAPTGVELLRGRTATQDLGRVRIEADVLRASLSNLERAVPNMALEGINLRFKPSNPSLAFGLIETERFEAYVRPSTNSDQSLDFLWRMQGARGHKEVDNSKSFNWHLEGQIDQLSSFRNTDFKSALNNWRRKDGRVKGLKASLSRQQVEAFFSAQEMRLDAQNRLAGTVDVELSGQGDPYDVLADLGLVEPKYALLAQRFVALPPLDVKKPVALKLGLNEGYVSAGPFKLGLRHRFLRHKAQLLLVSLIYRP